MSILENLLKNSEVPLVYSLSQDNRPRLKSKAVKVIDLDDMDLVKTFGSLVFRRVKRIVLAGAVPKKIIFKKSQDQETSGILKSLEDRNDHAVLGAVIDRLESLGIKVLDYESVVPEMMVPFGHIAGPSPKPEDLEDADYGRKILGKLLPLSFGQSIVVYRKSVVAVEAMEGTDQMILRSGGISKGGVLVKGLRPDQDRRYDIPVVGPKTLDSMGKSGLTCMALERGNCIVLDIDAFSKKAHSLGISVLGVEPCPSS